MLFHIAHGSDWSAASTARAYVVGSFETEGFMHLSTRDQFMVTAGRYYVGVEDLVLLEIDDAVLDPELLRFETSTNDELFPHYYAPLPREAIVCVHRFPCRPDGGFDRPGSVS